MEAATRHPDATRAGSDIICHCRQVPYARVREAVEGGKAQTLADVQRETTACTRCFGCRYEVESVLKATLGEAYVPSPTVRRGDEDDEATGLRRLLSFVQGRREPKRIVGPAKLFMPVLQGFGGHDVSTKIVLFNLDDESEAENHAVSLRADLTRLDGTRQDVWRTTIAPGHTTALEIADLTHDGSLPDGVGVMKLVLDRETMHSLRPYFHFTSPGGITSTHEKHGRTRAITKQHYHWLIPIAPKPWAEEAWYFLANAQPAPIEGRSLVYRDPEGREQSIPVPRLELDQAACIPLHEHIPEIADGTARGTVRIDPAVHVAGWMIQRDPEADLWRVQHL